MYAFDNLHFHRSCNAKFKCKKKCSCMINVDCGEDGRGDNTDGQEAQEGNDNGIVEEDNNTDKRPTTYKDYSIDEVGSIILHNIL